MFKYVNILSFFLALKSGSYLFYRELGLFPWFLKTNVPRRVAPGGYRLKCYILLQFGIIGFY